MTSTTSAQKVPMSRSQTLPYNKTGLEPKPVSVPVLSGNNSISSSRSSFSSSSSLDRVNNAPVFDPVTLEEIHRAQSPSSAGQPISHESLTHIDDIVNYQENSGKPYIKNCFFIFYFFCLYSLCICLVILTLQS